MFVLSEADQNLGSVGFVDGNIWQKCDLSGADYVFLGIWNSPWSLVQMFASETVPRQYLEKIQILWFLIEIDY